MNLSTAGFIFCYAVLVGFWGAWLWGEGYRWLAVVLVLGFVAAMIHMLRMTR